MNDLGKPRLWARRSTTLSDLEIEISYSVANLAKFARFWFFELSKPEKAP